MFLIDKTLKEKIVTKTLRVEVFLILDFFVRIAV